MKSKEKRIKFKNNTIKIDNKKGITLIALVVTIIVLLILAGITIASIAGENGILNRAKEASEKTKFASEKEAIEFALTEIKLNNNVEEESKSNIGRKLFDKNVENGDKWDIIVEKETGTIYGTGYTFIPKGTTLNDGTKTSSNWLIDKDGNLKELSDDGFTELDYKSTVGITEGLIFNMDATNLEKGQSNWGDNTTLRYFDNNTYSDFEKIKKAYDEQKNNSSVSQQDTGYDRQKEENTNLYLDSENNAFKFNGNNYIEIYKKNGFDFSKGLTFEFYGKLTKDIPCTLYDANVISLFGIWNGKYDNFPDTRFGVNLDRKGLVYSLFTSYKEEKTCGIFSESENNPFNQTVDYTSKGINLDNDIFFSVSIDPNGDAENATQIICANNEVIGEGWLSKNYYNYFLTNIKNNEYLDIGRCVWQTAGNWCYLKGSCYALRMYNVALDKEELSTNYNKTMAYRELLKNGN